MIERDGVRLWCDRAGDDASTALPLLLTHGFSATAEMWEPNLPALAARRPLITWDLRGHGRSDAPDNVAAYAEEVAVADMVALLDHYGVERAAIGGLSLGGYLSLAFHRRHPERTAALLLFDTGPGYRSEKPREKWNRMAIAMADAFDRKGLEALSKSSEVDRAHHRNPLGLARAARGTLVQHDGVVIESLPAIAVPTLVLVGADDAMFVGPAEYMAAKIPGARHVVVADAGHGANIDQPQAFDTAVNDFLDGLSD